jgi:hypothetical protein
MQLNITASASNAAHQGLGSAAAVESRQVAIKQEQVIVLGQLGSLCSAAAQNKKKVKRARAGRGGRRAILSTLQDVRSPRCCATGNTGWHPRRPTWR